MDKNTDDGSENDETGDPNTELDLLLSVTADVRSAVDILRFELCHSTPRSRISQVALREAFPKLEMAEKRLCGMLRKNLRLSHGEDSSTAKDLQAMKI